MGHDRPSPAPLDSSHSAASGALRIVLFYAAFSALWILMSDAAVTWLFTDPAHAALANTLKGWFFVAITSLLLYSLIQRLVEPGLQRGTLSKIAAGEGWQRAAWGYALAVLSSIGMLLVRQQISVSMGERPLLILFVFPVIISAAYGGLGPGLVATVLSSLLVSWFGIPPAGTFHIQNAYDAFQWGFLIANGALISVLSELMRRSRRQAELSLRWQAVMLGNIGDGVIATDTRDRITYVNPEAERLTGWSDAEARGRNLDEVLALSEAAGRAEEAADTGAPGAVRARDGHETPVRVRHVPLRMAGGRALGAMTLLRDDSAHRAAAAAVAALRESERTYRSLFENMLNGFAYCRMLYENGEPVDFVYLDVNEAFTRLTGLRDVVGRRVSEVIPGVQESDPELLAMYGRVASTGVPELREYRLEAMDEWYSLSIYSPAPGEFVAIFALVTERKRSELALRESERRFLDIARASSDWIWEIDNRGVYTYASENVEEILGYRPDEIVGKTPFDLMPPGEDERLAALFGEFVRGKQPFRDLENENVHRDGRVRHVRTTGIPLLTPTGALIGYRGVDRDVTAERSRSAALVESEARFRRLFNSMPVALCYVGSDGAIREVNERFSQVFGYARADLPTLDAWWCHAYPDAVYRAQVRATWDDAVRRAAAGSRDIEAIEYRVTCANGEVRSVLISGIVLRDGFLAVFYDMTERRRAEAEQRRLEEEFTQAQKMESIGRLAGGVAHDFNNMLGVILAHAELALMAPDLPEARRADLREIRQAAHRSADLTRQLLAFARKQVVSPRVIDLGRAVPETLKMLGRLIGEDISLRWTQHEGTWPIRIDPTQLDQILANLVVNARDAIEGPGTIAISVQNVSFDEAACARRPETRPGDFVVLSVADDGSGMAEDVRTRIFEPFFTTKEAGRGTGLGLATVYGIVKQNDGSIEVESTVGAGSTFRLYFPRVLVAETAASARASATIPRGRGETVLVVEDEAANLHVTSRILEQLGYVVLGASRPSQALEAAASAATLDLLLSDVVMPEMNGLALAELLRRGRPGLRTLFMSGYTADVISRDGSMAPGVELLEKPFSMRALAERVRELLDTR